MGKVQQLYSWTCGKIRYAEPVALCKFLSGPAFQQAVWGKGDIALFDVADEVDSFS